MALNDWYFRISVVVFLIVLRKLWNVLYSFWIGPANSKVDIKSYGKWAMVTGSTDGIGKEYARQLAARGCNIILVSRSLDKLKNVAGEIEKEFKVQTKIVQIDFTADPSIYDKLAKEIQGLEIGTLVNNVGLCYPYLEYFLDLPDWSQFMMNMVNVNVVPVLRVTGLVLPDMVKRGKGIIINMGSASSNMQAPLLVVYSAVKNRATPSLPVDAVSIIRVTGLVLPDMVKRGKGIIINMGSASFNMQAPLLAVYSAVKAFVVKFSDGLRYEYGHKGIIVQCLSPSLVATNMTGLDSNFVFPTPQKYVKNALSMLGSAYRSTGYFPHSCIISFYQFLEFLSEDFSAWFCRRSSELGQIMQLKKMERKK